MLGLIEYNRGMKEIRSYEELKGALAEMADDEYRDFVMKICPSERPFLGVRVPHDLQKGAGGENRRASSSGAGGVRGGAGEGDADC